MRQIRLIHGDVYADIIPGRQQPGIVWLYIVQRQGSADVLAMGACQSEEEAEESATEAIHGLRQATRAAGC